MNCDAVHRIENEEVQSTTVKLHLGMLATALVKTVMRKKM